MSIASIHIGGIDAIITSSASCPSAKVNDDIERPIIAALSTNIFFCIFLLPNYGL